MGMVVVATAFGAAAPAPQVSVSLRGVAAQTIEQGEPWRVAVRLDVPRGSGGSVVLAPTSGTWADAVAVELWASGSNVVAARAVAVGHPTAATATLDTTNLAGGSWRFSSEAMQAVTPGSYVVKVHLGVTGGSGWTGMADARAIPLTVVAAAAKPSVQRVTNVAQDLMLTDKVQEAAAVLDAELMHAPRDYALLKVRALVAERAGNPYAALMCLNAASFSPAKKMAGQPSAEDREMMARLEKARQTADANPAAWTWPPAEVLLALGEEAKKSGLVPAAPPPAGSHATKAPDRPAPSNVPATPVPAANPVFSVALSPVVATPVQGQPTPTATNFVTAAPPPSAGPLPGTVVPAPTMEDAKITADPSGQWAKGATAGSQYDKTQYSAAQATGAPNVTVAGNSPEAWCPASKDTGTDWLEVSFATPRRATEVRARQNNTVGAITKVEAIEPDGTSHVWWEGTDPYEPPRVREIAWFAVRVPATPYLVAKVKLTFNLAAVPGWKQIDAVQLLGSTP